VSIVQRVVGGRPFWFTTEEARREDPNTGESTGIGRYYVAFSTREPGPLVPGEVLKDDRGRARLFTSADEAVAAAVTEVTARLAIPTKVYAVGLPSGNTDREFQTYIDLLRAAGIDVNGKPRVEDSFGRKWLHVWDAREPAEQFASRLRRETRNPDWEVYELSPPAPQSDTGADQLEIYVGRQSDGSTYSLHPTSYKLIRTRFPGVRPHPSLFLERDARTAYEVTNGARYDQIAVLLTGLSTKQMNELGGYRVVDPAAGLVLHETDLAPISN
jgi:hypothetical protein